MRKVNLLFVFLVFILSSCSYHANYNSGYINNELSSIEKTIEGKALIYTELKQDEKLYSQKPSSLTGGSTTLNVKLGEVLKNISLDVFSKKFKEGAFHANKLENAEGYSIVIKPEILNFDYRYNQLQNLGFAITPEAKIDLFVFLYDQQGKLILEKKYVSEYLSGGTYVVNFSPSEKINKAIHQIIYNLISNVSSDVESALTKLSKRDSSSQSQ